MAVITNLHSAPITLTDQKTGERVTIPPAQTKLIYGDFSAHLFTLEKMMLADENDTDTDGDGVDVAGLRNEYESLFGKKAPSAMKAPSLQKAIDDEKARLAGSNENPPPPPADGNQAE
jgi:hypothetical protein